MNTSYGNDSAAVKPYFYLTCGKGYEKKINRIAERLRVNTVSVWCSSGIPHDQDGMKTINEKIQNCEAVFLIYTEDILDEEDPFVLTEFEIAKASGKSIYLVCLDDLDPYHVPVDKMQTAFDLKDNLVMHVVDFDARQICSAIVKEIGARQSIILSTHKFSDPKERARIEAMIEIPTLNTPYRTRKKMNERKAEVVTLGRYPQGEKGEAEPIEWLVLKREGSKVFLISRYCLTARPYNSNNGRERTTWADCTLRKWLNNEFLNTAFSEEEQKQICVTHNLNTANPKFETEGGAETDDKVFLLSDDEAETLIEDRDENKGVSTVYAAKQGAFVLEETNVCYYWLRTPGCEQYMAAVVGFDGSIESFGIRTGDTDVTVRPAMWIEQDELN